MFKFFTKHKIALLLLVNFFPLIVFAADPPIDPEEILDKIARYFAGVVLSVGVIIIIYGGFLFVTAAGDPEKVGKARIALTYGVVGIVIAALAFGIAGFVKNFFSVTG